MSKKTLLKGIIAVSAATTMLFSTAFAANYSTKTLYVKGSETVEVATTVTDLATGDEVTYLAGTPENPVYINQYTAAGGTETFTYKTTRTDFVGQSIKMAKANADFTNGQAITAASEDTLPAAGKFEFKITLNNEAQASVYANPEDMGAGFTINLGVALPANHQLTAVTVNGADATSAYTEGVLTYEVAPTINADNSFSPAYAEVAITTEEIITKDYAAPVFASGFKADEYSYTFGEEVVTGRMFAIYATADEYPANTEFGIAVSYDAEFAADATTGFELYPSASLAEGTDYAIAIIDEDDVPADKVFFRTYYIKGGNPVLAGGKCHVIEY